MSKAPLEEINKKHEIVMTAATSLKSHERGEMASQCGRGEGGAEGGVLIKIKVVGQRLRTLLEWSNIRKGETLFFLCK